MAKVQWIKLSTEMFSNPKIKYIRSLPEGNAMLLIWCMLLTKAGSCNANGYILLTEHIPYTPKMLANEFGMDEQLIQLATGIFQKLGMIQLEGEAILISGWAEHQNVKGLESIREGGRLRTQKCRERKKELPQNIDVTPCNVTCNDDVTDGNSKSSVTLYIEKENKNKNNKYIEQMDLLWSLYPNKKGKAKAYQKLPKLLATYGVEQLQRCVMRYTSENRQKQVDPKYIAHGSTYFTSTYVDYLDENYTDMKISSVEAEEPDYINV